MNCRYCGSVNLASDHRCLRCGRRLHGSVARPAPDVYPVEGARALAADPQRYQPDSQPVASADDIPVPESRRRAAPFQPQLFNTRDLGRVVPIEAYQARAAERRARAQSNESGASRSRYAVADDQQAALPFATAPAAPVAPAAAAATATAARAASKESALARLSRAPVAIPTHRMMAAAIDFSIVLIAAGMLASTLYLWLGGLVLRGNPMFWFAGLAVLLGFVYKGSWALAGVDSPGLRGCQLRLLNFDGMEPTRTERLRRLAWSLLSILPGGLGLVWSLVDEETLSWHDHSSKTFLTSFSTPGKARR